MRLLLITLLIGFLMIGCSVNKTLPDNKYHEYGTYKAELQKCFESGAVSPKLYADATSALSYALNTQGYDRKRLSSTTQSLYSRSTPTPQVCRNVEAFSYQVISAAAESKTARNRGLAALNRSSSVLLNNTLNGVNTNRPVICNQIGPMTTVCN